MAEQSARSSRHTISIVIPVHDEERTIASLLDSVCRQSCGSWEAIVVDDGSTDRTAEIVRERCGHDRRLRLLQQPQQGVSAARNAGIEAARSEWLLFLDADDRIVENYVEKMLDAVERHPDADAVRCGWGYASADGRVQHVFDPDLEGGAELFEVAARRSPFAIHACVVRREIVREVGGFDPRLAIAEDWDLWQRIARRGVTMTSVGDVLAYYVVRPESAMHRDLDRAVTDSITVYRRGHSNDLRVPRPDPRFVDGLALEPSHDAGAELVLYLLAVGLLDGRDVTQMRTARHLEPATVLDPLTVAQTLYESVPFGGCRPAEDWPAMWESTEAPLTEALHRFAQWSGHTTIVEPSLRHLERLIIAHADVRRPLRLGRTLGVRIDVADGIESITPPSGVEHVIAQVSAAATPVGVVDIPVVGNVVEAGQISEVLRLDLGPRLVRSCVRHPRLVARLIRGAPRAALVRATLRLTLDLSWSDRAATRDVFWRFVRWFARSALIGSDVLSGAAARDGATRPAIGEERPTMSGRIDESSEQYFESIFDVEDPWAYTNEYEQTKYEQTLRLIENLPIARALEVACAEGHFTERLAPRVGHLIASDVAPTALQRAQRRCAHLDNIEYRHLDLRTGELPADLDLIVCSEVLYFLPDEPALRAVADRFVGALAPGGHLLAAHAKIIGDDPTTTGFAWDEPFGGERIGSILGSVPELELRHEVTTELYKIQLFQRAGAPSAVDRQPVVEFLHHAAELGPEISRMVMWGGATMTPARARQTELTDRLSVLMYHRVSPDSAGALDQYRVHPDAFEEQLADLRRNGYSGITAEHWQHAMTECRPPPGRTVMLTFDDGYQDFFDHAWPLLDAYGFPATVFIVPEFVGSRAAWDQRFGPPAPLMSWEQITQLSRRSIEFASHSTSHEALTQLAPREAFERERRGREELRHRLGRPVTVLAYPFGAHDAPVRHTMRAAGYTTAFTSDPGLATVWDDPMALPRTEITGDMALEEFRSRLARPAPHSRLRTGARALRRRARR